MPRHGSQVARERLNILWEKFVCGVATERTPTDGHIEDISDFTIDFHPQFDFESLDISGPSIEARHKVLIWFKPLAEDVLERFPCKAPAQEFFEYVITREDPRWKPEDRTQAVYTLPPSTFHLGPGADGSYPQLDFWRVGDIYETMRTNNQKHAHALLTLQAWHSLDGQEDRILLGELYTIICAMRNRVNQRKADSKEEEEALWSFPVDVEYRGFEFEAKTHFPVILLSYVGSQHGRIIYAYMDRHRLVICQSKLYSFEKEETAPLNLFTRMLLSRPL